MNRAVAEALTPSLLPGSLRVVSMPEEKPDHLELALGTRQGSSSALSPFWAPREMDTAHTQDWPLLRWSRFKGALKPSRFSAES